MKRKIESQEVWDYVILNLDTGNINLPLPLITLPAQAEGFYWIKHSNSKHRESSMNGLIDVLRCWKSFFSQLHLYENNHATYIQGQKSLRGHACWTVVTDMMFLCIVLSWSTEMVREWWEPTSVSIDTEGRPHNHNGGSYQSHIVPHISFLHYKLIT